ncbi:MAG: hypothetical protein A2X86_10150 [Bdellovibrionales bacterium GWA2_49_15]|nr:MAG: hypothetical protein A2X86_10150 [Bdellovibrionales bacterium GWA2_49_15]HAZ13746.1 cytochrome C [Bdellovibrionales bacterium]
MKLFLLATMIFSTTFAMADDEIFSFTNKMGTVTFNHTAHQTREAQNCAICHPAFAQEYDDAVSIKDVAHATCKACHTERAAGPTKCTGCHVK